MRRSASSWRRRRTPKAFFPRPVASARPSGRVLVSRSASAIRAPHRRHPPATSQGPNTPTRPGRGDGPRGRPHPGPDQIIIGQPAERCHASSRNQAVLQTAVRAVRRPGPRTLTRQGRPLVGGPPHCHRCPGARMRPVDRRWALPSRPHLSIRAYCAHSAGNARPVCCSHRAGVYRPSRNAPSRAFTRPGCRASPHFRNAPVTR